VTIATSSQIWLYNPDFLAETPCMNLHRKVRRPGRWTLLAGVSCIAIAVVSINAWADFSGSVTSAGMNVNAAHLQLQFGATNDLTTNVTGMAPQDLAQRAVDLDINASTTTGIINGVTLADAVSASSSPNGGALDDSNGLKIWVLKCSVAWGGGPAPTPYTCGGSLSDVLGNYHATVGGATLPSAGTCPPGGVTTSTIHTLESTPGSLSNITTTGGASNHLVVYMCFPNSDNDTYQDAGLTALTFTFAATQRSGTNK
jgi:hypothetical protein